MITIDLALLFEDCAITVGPRDKVSQDWLVAGGEIHCVMPLAKIREHWQMRGISKRDLPVIAAELEYHLNGERGGYERWCSHGGPDYQREEVCFRVRACEYRNVVVSQQLCEISR
jgi:hypothetical protein